VTTPAVFGDGSGSAGSDGAATAGVAGPVRAPANSERPPVRRRPRPVVSLRGVHKIYGEGDTAVAAVAGVDLLVQRGDFVAVMGASGSGKTTLMNIIGCLDAPTRGRYLLDGVDTRRLDARRQSTIRNRKIGFIFQSFNLIPLLDVTENVALPFTIAGADPGRVRDAVAGFALTVRSGPPPRPPTSDPQKET